MPGWKIAARLADVMRFTSLLNAKTDRRSRIYRSSWRLSGGSCVMSSWYVAMALSRSNFSVGAVRS